MSKKPNCTTYNEKQDSTICASTLFWLTLIEKILSISSVIIDEY